MAYFKRSKEKSPILFVIQEKTSVQSKSVDFMNDFDSTENLESDLKTNIYKKLKMIQVDTHEIGCRFLCDELGWIVSNFI